MALSSFLKTSALRGQTLKILTNQVLRSSSQCVQHSPHLSVPISTINVTNKNAYQSKFLMPATGSSAILAKYFASSPVLKSADGKGHDHVTIWKLERALSVALLPLVPAALLMPNQLLDTLVAVGIVMHTHWGLEAIVVDYVRPILFGELGPKIGMGLLYLFSAITLAGCLHLIYTDIGLANAFRELWKL